MSARQSPQNQEATGRVDEIGTERQRAEGSNTRANVDKRVRGNDNGIANRKTVRKKLSQKQFYKIQLY